MFITGGFLLFTCSFLKISLKKPRLDTKALCTSHRSGSCILDFLRVQIQGQVEYVQLTSIYTGVYLCIAICMLPKIFKNLIHRFGGDDQYFVYDMNLSRHVLFNNIM